MVLSNKRDKISVRLLVWVAVPLVTFASLFTFLPQAQTLKASSEIIELPSPHPARLADRLSVVMRGVPASASEKQQMEDGATDLRGLAEKYRTDERFAERLTQYWAQVLKITAPIDFSMIENRKGESLLSDLRVPISVSGSRSLIYRKPESCLSTDPPRFELYFRIQSTANDVERLRKRCDSLPAGSSGQQECEIDLRREESRARVTENFRAIHDCTCAEAIDVNPWWNPASTVKACPTLIQSCPMGGDGKCTKNGPENLVELCGQNLSKCMPFDSRIENASIPSFLDPLPHDGNRFFSEVYVGLTLEPAMLIAKTIQDNRDYREILTTTKTVLTGAVESFLKSPRGEVIRSQSAGGFNNGNTLVANQSERKSWRLVERGSGNAGVLTTPAYHQVTNGYRAKANRAYESFLCRKFVIPPGVVDGNPEELDLTKRQPCASCHIELEPLSKMFKRWPEEGTNFLYTASNDAKGGFTLHPQRKFEAGEDVAGLASLLVKDERFAECAVQRAFEFAVGREPSEYDVEHFFPKWKQKFVSENYKVWPVMLEIIQSVYFRGGWK